MIQDAIQRIHLPSFLRWLHPIRIKGDRCQAAYRGGKGFNVKISQEGGSWVWFDHVRGIGGNAHTWLLEAGQSKEEAANTLADFAGLPRPFDAVATKIRRSADPLSLPKIPVPEKAPKASDPKPTIKTDFQAVFESLEPKGFSGYFQGVKGFTEADLGALPAIRFGKAEKGQAFTAIPLVDHKGRMQGIQRLSESQKGYWKGTQKKGAFVPIGFPQNPDSWEGFAKASPYVLFCEGVATGLSLFLATCFPVIAALDAGHLREAPATLQKRWKLKKASILVCADHDQTDERGKNAGIDAARGTGFAFVSPAKEGQDFDDLRRESGLDAVREAVLTWQADPCLLARFKDKIERSFEETCLRTVESRYLPSLEERSGLVLVRSAQGTGKTEGLKALLKGKKRVLYISPRIALCRSVASKLGLLSYEGKSPDALGRINRLSICLNSLWKLAKGAEIPAFDVVILDESEQTLRQTIGDLVSSGDKPLVWGVLRTLLQQAPLVIGLDADLSDLSVKTLQTLRGRPEKPAVVWNTYKAGEGRTFHLYPSREAVLSEALEAAKA